LVYWKQKLKFVQARAFKFCSPASMMRRRPFIVDAASLCLRTVNKYSLRNAALLIGTSVPIALGTYGISLWLLQLYLGVLASYYGPSGSYSSVYQPSEILVFDSILLILGGAAFLLGSGGISRNTSRAAQIASVASAMGKETVGPSEMMRRDAWKPKGHIRLGLTLITAGIFLIILSFLLVYIPL